MQYNVIISGGRVVGLAVTLLHAVSMPAFAGSAVFPENGLIELVTWENGQDAYKIVHTCSLSGKSIHCDGSITIPEGQVKMSFALDGTVNGGNVELMGVGTTRYSAEACSATATSQDGFKLELDDSGHGSGTSAPGTLTWTGASAKCAILVGKTEQQPSAPMLATWRILDAVPDDGFGDQQTKSALWKQLGQAEGPLARKCFEETFAKLKKPDNAEIKGRIETAAYQQHMVDVAVEAAKADDFDPNWLESAKSIGGSGGTKQRVTDTLAKGLPGLFGTLVRLSQKAYRLSNGINEKALLPKLKGKLYDAYAAERTQRPNDSPVEVLKDASTHVGSWEKVKTDLIKYFPGTNDNAREQAMAEYLAARFDFLAKVREVAANKEKHLADAWKNVANDIARIRSDTLDCMVK